jgi:flavin-dependent dehydrogenase
VARSVDAPVYNEKPSLTAAYYSYWENVPIASAELYPRPRRAVIAFPTNDNLVCVLVQCVTEDAGEFRRDLERNYLAAIDLAPDLAERVRAGRQAEPIRGTTHLPNFFRKPFGSGWALVGDAGLHRDPITAQGICDAFRDAELLSDALDFGIFRGRADQ